MPNNQGRLQAIQQITSRTLPPVMAPPKLEEIWAEDVFTLTKMKAMLPKGVYKSLKATIEEGGKLDIAVADVVATVMKEWAMNKGALYYAHVFYPMTNASAEKHDGFIIPSPDGTAISEFPGKLLVQGEPDGSSFPNGGIRSTNAARGYTAWDVTSPAFVTRTNNGATLCIPTVFVSWTGEALDKKSPLLRSNAAMNKAAQRVLKALGHTNVSQVNSSCGAEQEYFLVDSALASLRPDLLLAGRTLFGKKPAKAQQFDDHYFGAIPERVQMFMQDVEYALYRLGIPAKTRHNEVAPGQFEIAPYFESANVAADHQHLLMTTFRNTAKRHGFMVLFHEKPFAGVNGSGKHVNWSVGNSTQGNLLDPGDTPHDNAQFLVFCGAVIRGVHKYGPLLRAVVASASNDHRLGANEAPPAIMSVYLGDQLEGVFNLLKQGAPTDSKAKGVMNLGVDSLPTFAKDAGDRNRTSPFAFTGNRFEFRAVGASASVAGPLVAMNTILADSLHFMADKLEASLAAGTPLNKAIASLLKTVMEEHGAVVFGGNGYSKEWHEEAERRGIANLATSAEALPILKKKDVEALFSKLGVLTPVELQSRFDVYSEQFIHSINVEARLVISMAKTLIYPAAMECLSDLTGTVSQLKTLGVDSDKTILKKVAELSDKLLATVGKLATALEKDHFDSSEAHLNHSAHVLRPLMDEARSSADALEAEMGDKYWPLPTYQELLFIK
jgi:glutamine synthetase